MACVQGEIGCESDFILMEDNAAGHGCWYMDTEREKEGIKKIN